MSMIKKIKKFIMEPEIRKGYIVASGVFNWVSDETYIKAYFKSHLGYKPDLDNPKTLNEKLNWLKLYNRRPEYTTMVDKYKAKQFVAERIGAEHVVPLLGVWNTFDEIDFESLPNSFVLKCTHDGGPVICKDKKDFDKEYYRAVFEKKLKTNYFNASREWPYKNVERKIIAEEYIPSLGHRDSTEYKITCCNGKVKMITVCTGIAHASLDERNNDHFDRDWNVIPMYAYYKNSGKEFAKPDNLDELIDISEKLAKDVPYLRVDLYDVDGHIYFGEMTFFTWGGWIRFNPPEYDRIMGDWVELPEKYNQ